MTTGRSSTEGRGSFTPYVVAYFTTELLPILPPDAKLSLKSTVSASDRGKVPGRYSRQDDTWSGYPAWTDLQATEDKIKVWETWPGVGVGLQTRRFVAVDIDVDDAALADELQALCHKVIGPAPVRTRPNSSRRAMLYRAPAGVELRKQRLAFTLPGSDKKHAIELLGDGQQFVIDGEHPDGGRYVWDREIRSDELTEFPQELWEGFRTNEQARQQLTARGATIAESSTSGGGGKHIPIGQNMLPRDRWPELARALHCIPNDEQSRENWVSNMHALKAAVGGDDSFYADHVVKWSLRYEPNDTEDDPTRTLWDSIDDAEFGGLLIAARAREYGYTGAVEFDEIPDDWTPPVDPCADIYDTGDADDGPLKVINAASLAGVPIPEQLWIVRDWIPADRVSSLYGAGGEGKTMAAQMLATACAIGALWFGQPVMRCRSLLYFCEDDEAAMLRRQAAINAFYGCDFGDLELMDWLPQLGDETALMTVDSRGARRTALFGHMRRMARRLDSKLIITDTMADVFSGNENDRSQVRAFVQSTLGLLARETRGGAVLALAHPSRAGIASGAGTSGSTAWEGTVRSLLTLKTPKDDGDGPVDDNLRLLTRQKSNNARRGETIELKWHNGVLVATSSLPGAVPPGDRRSCEQVFMALLDKMTSEGQTLSAAKGSGNYAPRKFAERRERDGYTRKDFERTMQVLFAENQIVNVPYGKPANSYKKIVRGSGSPPGFEPITEPV